MKKIWRKNFEIKRMSFYLAQEVFDATYEFQSKTTGKKNINEAIWINKDEENIATYFLKDQLRDLVNDSMNKVIKRPDLLISIHQQNTGHVRQLFKLLVEAQKLNLLKLSDRQLVHLYDEIFRLVRLTHGTAICTTWFIDSDGEDLTKYLINIVKNKIENLKFKMNFAEVFSILTTPSRYSNQQLETIESLEILKLIKNNNFARQLFLTSPLSEIEANLGRLSFPLRKKIKRHYKKWHFTPYTYNGPAYSLDYYLEVWSSLLKQKFDFNQELDNLRKINQETRAKKNQIIKKLKLNEKEKMIFDFAADIVWLKAYRKDSMFYASYIVDLIYREIGKRLSISFNQARHFTAQEVKEAMLKHKFSIGELNARIKAFVIYYKTGKQVILTGKKMKLFLAGKKFERIQVANINELKGTPACPGKVKGIVKIINVPDDMGKMNLGDIMISHTTFPALVPAMKKAVAIVTDDGGLTCHAAIVARELKKPCIVGTKMATAVLKDGDKVMIDANEGVVKKIINNKYQINN